LCGWGGGGGVGGGGRLCYEGRRDSALRGLVARKGSHIRGGGENRGSGTDNAAEGRRLEKKTENEATTPGSEFDGYAKKKKSPALRTGLKG